MTEIAQIAQAKLGEGNTLASPTLKRKGRKWIIVINNYTEDDLLKMLNYFKSFSNKYIIGKEIGASGTPHLQAYVNLKVQRTFTAMKKTFPTAHLEAAKGNDKQNFLYCAKDGDFQTNMVYKIPKKVRDPLEGKTLYPYQQQVIDLVKVGDNDRTINWFWEHEGNVGKSSLCKHLCLNYNCIILNGKQSDMFNAILMYQQRTDDYPEVVIIDIPRSMTDYVSWGGIEAVKNGLFLSGKYEGGMCVFNSPTVICFANSPPDLHQMSADRWKIIQIAQVNVSVPTEPELSSAKSSSQ